MSTCACGRKMPANWNGEQCSYCWLNSALKDDKIQFPPRFVTVVDKIRIKGKESDLEIFVKGIKKYVCGECD